MEPTAAMAHTRLVDGSIPAPTEEAAVADESVRKIQGRTDRGGGNQAKEGEGRRDQTEASPRFLVCDRHLSVGTKTAS